MNSVQDEYEVFPQPDMSKPDIGPIEGEYFEICLTIFPYFDRWSRYHPLCDASGCVCKVFSRWGGPSGNVHSRTSEFLLYLSYNNISLKETSHINYLCVCFIFRCL